MKKFLLLCLLFTCLAHAQEDAWVYFTDKPDAGYYLANPLEMLSQKALDRRANQGIALDEQDVPIHPDYITGIETASGITVMAKSKWLNALHVRGSQQAINALENLSYVDYVAFANQNLNNGRVMQPAQLLAVQNTQENYNYGGSAGQVQMLNAHLLHQQGYTGEGITIAVLDAGFPGVNTAAPFQHLMTNNLVLGGYDFVANSPDFYGGGNHGTRILSTLAGYTENQLVGTAPDAFYYLFRTENADSENPVEESYWVEAAEMADSLGVDIINTSLGYLDYDNPDYTYTYADLNGQTAFMSRGANVAFTRGMLVVVSAGNNGDDPEPHVMVPGDAFNALTVGAVDQSEQYAYFSAIGPTVDGRVKPDVMAKGFAATYANTDGTIATGNGTSFAAPVMAGAVACLWQAAPNRTNAEILQIVKQSADRYNNPDSQYGYGIPDFSIALEDALGMPEVNGNTFTLYPNPAANVVHFSATASLVTLYNTLGQEMFKAQATDTINIESLPPGIYTYVIEAGASSIKGKILKQ
ncbi:peptidase S8 [Flavobacterium akiainvivens]|uniref:Peptidase S8 n=1 Tax=Flavobacterium akiainvivens TaxID=1202724 RepID=A0A0M9VHV1_9FLAO|nr:S8 family serine peptidase [Flavobacterium akiainvivens]KOS05966.1 peptidase S8 [Flavobacterium akiainvivens]SFQ53712.1 Por secretion system C-terminal sorting domain-containing protein [Flavobacterium akiainvivens]